MNIRRTILRVVVPAALCSLGALAAAGTPKTAGRMTLDVRGPVDDVVLVDPLGRGDRYTNGIPDAKIPGCDRWPGGMGGELDEPDSVRAKAAELTTFQMSFVQYGRYLVYTKADSPVVVNLQLNFDSADTVGCDCVGLERTDRVGAGRRAWAVDVRRTPPKGECAVRITLLHKKK